jgi:N-acyl-D-amino-acid deacylase
VLTHLL